MNLRNQKLSPRVDGRLAAYATLAGVALAAPALAPSADATVVYSGVVNINVPTTGSGVYINVVTGAVGDSSTAGWDLNPWGSSSFNVWANNSASPMDGVIQNFTGGNSATLVDNLPLLTPINGASGYTWGRSVGIETAGATAFNLSSDMNYIGFRFTNEDAGGQIQYGWMRFSLAATSAGQPRMVVEYGYEDAGNSINVGEVPEPTTMALLGVMAAGALGVRAWRKRKAA